MKILREERRNWRRRYGDGYFYQGWNRLAITGQRATEIRFEKYGLGRLLRPDMRILDIGANACMLACAMAEHVKSVVAVEYNPYQISIGMEVAEFLGLDNITFINDDFLSADLGGPYDLITSFANHQTADGNMRPVLRSYLEKLHGLLKVEGILLFESHDYDLNDPKFHGCMEGLGDLYVQLEKKEFAPETIGNTSPLSGRSTRLFYVLKKKQDEGAEARPA